MCLLFFYDDYLEYNSTIKFSLIFSGISSRLGKFKNLPVSSFPSHSNHENLLICLPETEAVIASRDFERSLTDTISPGRRLYEGILTTSPLTSICLCPTNWRAAERVGAIPKRYTVLSKRASNNLNNSSPVIPSLEEALVKRLAN